MSAPSLASQAAASYGYPQITFGKREQQLLASVKTYVDSLSPDTVITTQGDIIIGDASGNAIRLAKGSSGLPLVAGASTVSYAQIAAAGIASDAVITAKILDANVTTAKIAPDAVDNTRLADAAVSLENLDSGIAPSHIVKFAGTFTTVGGDTTESIPVTGAVSGDIVCVTVRTAGAVPVSIVASAPTTDAITVTLSADPSTDHVLQYEVLRAAS